VLKDACTFACYEGGRMVCRDEQARAQPAHDLRKLAETTD
jgi:hypothetical protein